MKKIRKAVFPVGGLGTRFLPATKSLPKEMLPVANKPLIQHAFEEAAAAGIEQFIFITGRNKNAINNHFDNSYELEAVLSSNQKQEALGLARDWLPSAGNIIFIRQQNPLGLGHAVWCARNVIGDEPFAVLLADELFISKRSGSLTSEMVKEYEVNPSNVIAVADIAPSDTDKYGIVAYSEERGHSIKITDMVEKPKPAVAPSNTSIVGRYILHPEIFYYLEKTEKGSGGEIQLTDAMRSMLHSGSPFSGYRLEGKRLDCGNYLGLLEANIEFSLLDKSNTAKVQSILGRIMDRSKE
jgi:UTP--glucose-1-phosphate uridylyltransferase